MIGIMRYDISIGYQINMPMGCGEEDVSGTWACFGDQSGCLRSPILCNHLSIYCICIKK